MANLLKISYDHALVMEKSNTSGIKLKKESFIDPFCEFTLFAISSMDPKVKETAIADS